MDTDSPSASEIVSRIIDIQARIRDAVIAQMKEQSTEELSAVAAETSGDTIYAIDRVSEDLIRVLFAEAFSDTTIVIVGEGLDDGGEVFPKGSDPDSARFRVIIDPIDGTRGLMYDKRSAWVLTGVAENRGDETNLTDIFAAVQTEIPTSKQFRSDVLSAVRGQGAEAFGFDVTRNKRLPIRLVRSGSDTIEHGFAMISRFFQGGKDILARIEEEIVEKLIGPIQSGKARLFEDQYICTGGQFYELMAGHDRFNADLRPDLESALSDRGQQMGICCHPYDVCTELIAREMGVHIVKPNGSPLDSSLDTTSPVAWAGYANDRLRASIEPVLVETLGRFGM
jgi:fructose-1,6-bisphosphatase/inositol monophosphatase family enzyme